MKKQFSIRSLAILALFTLLSFTGLSQVSLKVPQDTANARALSQVKKLDSLKTVNTRLQIRLDTSIANIKRVRASVDTVKAVESRIRVRLDTTNAKLALLKTNNYVLRLKQDTLAQSMRVLINATDSNSIYLSRNGNVGGFTTKIYTTITTSTVTYTAGDNLGGIITVTNALRTTAGTGALTDLQIWSTETQSLACTVDIWSASPSGSFVNNTAQVITGDQAVWLGSVTFAASDYITTGTIVRAHLKNLNIPISGQAARSIFLTIVGSGAPAWTGGTSGFYLTAGFKRD